MFKTIATIITTLPSWAASGAILKNEAAKASLLGIKPCTPKRSEKSNWKLFNGTAIIVEPADKIKKPAIVLNKVVIVSENFFLSNIAPSSENNPTRIAGVPKKLWKKVKKKVPASVVPS